MHKDLQKALVIDELSSLQLGLLPLLDVSPEQIVSFLLLKVAYQVKFFNHVHLHPEMAVLQPLALRQPPLERPESSQNPHGSLCLLVVS